jgi:hypothetical protein
MEGEGKERRREKRFKIEANVEVRCLGKTFNAQTVDISKRGFGFVSAKLINPGTKIDAVIFLKTPERVSGEVKWVIAEPDPSGGAMSYRTGVAVKGTIPVPGE